MYECQYTNVFAIESNQKYISLMSNKMREILKNLMEKHGDSPTSLSQKCGVPQPTIQRFLKGGIEDMRTTNAKKIANAYSLNESQLRGDMPIGEELLDSKVKTYSTADPHLQAVIEMLLKTDKTNLEEIKNNRSVGNDSDAETDREKPKASSGKRKGNSNK